jgi:hypothetical protein
LYEATEQHPAQIEKWAEDVRIGTYTTKRWSGMLTPREKYEILSRIDILQQSVKRALSEANRTPHSKDRIASQIFEFIHGDLDMTR